MNTDAQASLVREIQGHLRDGTSALAPSEFEKPIATYTNPETLDREREVLFRRTPVVVGHASQIPAPGDFLATEIAGAPVLVVRQADDSVRAFANLCRHRGARVVEQDCGSAERFRCPYHAWSYGLDGRLLSIPDQEAFAGVDRSSHGLVPLPAEERHGFLWVVCSADAEIDVAAHLGPLDAELAGFGLDQYVEERHVWLRDRFNWKLVVDGFLEAYHLPILHPKTAGRLIRARPAPFEEFGPHGRMVAVRKSFEQFIDADAADVDLLPHIAIVYQIFPNSVLVWQGGHFEFWSAAPEADDPEFSASRVSLLAPSAEQAKSRVEHWDKNWTVLMRTVEAEDFPVARSIQKGFATGYQDSVIFGRNEPALQHFHRMLHAELSKSGTGLSKS